jgi:hypothetical protein
MRHAPVVRALLLSVSAALAFGACLKPDDRPTHPWATRPEEERDISTDTGTTPADSARRAQNAAREPGLLSTVHTEAVVGWTGPGGKSFEITVRTNKPATALFRPFGTITLRNSLRERSPDLGQYPCTSCHLGRTIVMHDERITDAHQNLKAVHPKQTGSTCATCHSPDNVELLALKNGQKATLDHVYRLCAQCHVGQATAWAGGGHGKRLDGWQGRRVVMGCADCHNPHAPALTPRIPFRAPHIDRIRGTVP